MFSIFRRRKADGKSREEDVHAGLRHHGIDQGLDPLTALPNRQAVEEHLRDLMLQAREDAIPGIAVIFLDLDRFGRITTGIGYRAADEVLRAVGKRLRNGLQDGEFLGRFAADQFIVISPKATSIGPALALAARMRARLGEPLSINGNELFVTLSAGVGLWNSSYQEPEDLIRDADIAMRHSKKVGRESISVFDEDWLQECVGSLKLQNELQRALEHEEFEVFYQPILSLRSGRIAGFEALSRWRHPEYGLTPPAYFIEMAEESGAIIEIDRHLLEKACRQLRSWHTSYRNFSDLYLSVNVSSLEFLHPDLVSRIDRTLRNSGTYGRNIRLELTESLLMENSLYAAQMLEQLRRLQIGISIDDFGTGYSSLAYLRRFDIDTIKIDYSFVQQMTKNGESAEIVRNIASLAENLGKQSIAEGVETRSQFDALREIGVDAVQGYFVAPPLEAHRAGELMAQVQDRDNHLECILENRLHHHFDIG